MLEFPIEIAEANFYITNICNLTCNNCITFNNLNFKGHYNWKDYESKNLLWPSYIHPKKVTLIGGEPFSNPDILNWVTGIRQLWPAHDNMSVTTNGTFFNKKKYQEIAKTIISLKIRLEVSVHSPQQYQDTYNYLTAMLAEMNIPYRYTWKETDLNDRIYDLPAGVTIDDLKGQDDETKFIHATKGYTLFTLAKKYIFQSNAIKFIDKKQIVMYQSDPNIAHEMCCYKDFHYVYKGDLYKCHVPAVSRDFSNQYILEENSLDLINRYKPCDPTDDPDQINNFLSNIENSIDQCSLCPTKLNIKPALPYHEFSNKN
jgi:organic radical activating enzyme